MPTCGFFADQPVECTLLRTLEPCPRPRASPNFQFYLEKGFNFLRNELTCKSSMNLSDILSTEQIVVDLNAVDRWQAIDELIDCLVSTGKLKAADRSAIVSVVRKRESSMSTGIGFGIGIPHASTDLLHEVVGALGRSKEGVNFEALDNQPVNLIVLFLVPQGQFQKHLHTLANIAKLLHRREFRKALEDSPNAAEMYRIIRTESISK